MILFDIMVKEYLLLLCAFLGITGTLEQESFYLDLNTEETLSNNFKYDQIYRLNVTSLSFNTRGIILYAISHNSLVSISLQENFSSKYTTNGVSVAMIKLLEEDENNAFFYLILKNIQNCTLNGDERIDIYAIEFSSDDPLPGGCNLVYEPDYYPILNFSTHRLTAQLDYQLSNVGFSFNKKEPICDTSSSLNQNLLYDVYVDFISDYYSSTSCCLTNNVSKGTENISQNFQKLITSSKTSAVKLITLNQNEKMEFFLVLDSCVSTVVYVNVRDPITNGSSFYAPAIIWKDNCSKFDVTAKVLSILLCVFGLVLCLFGSRIFAFELFLFTSLSVFIITFIVVSKMNHDIDLIRELEISVGVAFVSGCVVVALWLRFGYAHLASIFISFVGGILLTSFLFISPFANMKTAQGFAVFIILALSAVMFYFIMISFQPLNGCVFSSALVGSYLVLLSLSSGVFFCSQISYIVPLSLYRFTESNMESAFVLVSLKTIDFILIAIWIVLFLIGGTIQFSLMKRQPVFPESPFVRRRLRQCQFPETPQRGSSDESLSSRGPSFTSENYEGDVSDDLNGFFSTESTSTLLTSDDTVALVS